MTDRGILPNCYPVAGVKVVPDVALSVDDRMASDQCTAANRRRGVLVTGVPVVRIQRLANDAIITDNGAVPYFDIVVNDCVVPYANVTANLSLWADIDAASRKFHCFLALIW